MKKKRVGDRDAIFSTAALNGTSLSMTHGLQRYGGGLESLRRAWRKFLV